MTWPHPLTHPPTHQTIHPPFGGEVSTDFKSSKRIEISWLVQVLLNFDWFQGPPLGGGGVGGWGGGWWAGGGCRVVRGWGVGGWGWGWWGGALHTCAHAGAHTHMHAHARVYDIIGNSHGFSQWGWPFAWNYHVYHACMCVRVRVCMRMHVHMCGVTPQPPPTPIYPPPTPQSHREPETPKFNNSWTNQGNSILFEDSLPLNILNSYRL